MRLSSILPSVADSSLSDRSALAAPGVLEGAVNPAVEHEIVTCFRRDCATREQDYRSPAAQRHGQLIGELDRHRIGARHDGTSSAFKQKRISLVMNALRL